LEVSLTGAYQSNTITNTVGSTSNEYKESNFTSNTLGAKYLFFDPYRKKNSKNRIYTAGKLIIVFIGKI